MLAPAVHQSNSVEDQGVSSNRSSISSGSSSGQSDQSSVASAFTKTNLHPLSEFDKSPCRFNSEDNEAHLLSAEAFGKAHQPSEGSFWEDIFESNGKEDLMRHFAFLKVRLAEAESVIQELQHEARILREENKYLWARQEMMESNHFHEQRKFDNEYVRQKCGGAIVEHLDKKDLCYAVAHERDCLATENRRLHSDLERARSERDSLASELKAVKKAESKPSAKRLDPPSNRTSLKGYLAKVSSFRFPSASCDLSRSHSNYQAVTSPENLLWDSTEIKGPVNDDVLFNEKNYGRKRSLSDSGLNLTLDHLDLDDYRRLFGGHAA